MSKDREVSFKDRPKPWFDPPKPGPTVLVDIDGVVASMDKFTHLLAAPAYKDRDWKSFHANFKHADLIRPVGKLVRALHDAGFTIAYTTTRLDQFMPGTDRWIRKNSLPPGHIESRSLWIDGSIRPALDVKRRQWWRWQDKYQQDNPLVAWIDDERAAVDALREQGCPAWLSSDLLEQYESGDLVPAIDVGPEPADSLALCAEAARSAWDASQAPFEARQREWRTRHAERMRQRAIEKRMQGRTVA
ncbi:hypothetical protein [Prescottella subtropica]|uniref:hypothetical protein n=1 Tax=Prescottella subtropica TaxID=2545757 RepID=UPI001F4F7450|nr:hypothetical protein [Prescottella subtropica]